MYSKTAHFIIILLTNELASNVEEDANAAKLGGTNDGDGIFC